MFDDHVILHMHLLTYAIVVSASSLEFLDPGIRYSFRRCVIAPPTV